MKKLVICLTILFLPLLSNAQNGTLFLSFRGAVGVNDVWGAGFSFDYNTKYYNQNEVFADYRKSNDTGYETALAGFGIKPVLTRSTNTAFRFRFGLGIGSDFRKFIAAPHLGFELAHTLPPRIDLFIGNKNQVLLWAPSSERWRFNLDFGVRFPLN
tara:strand:+ start:1115 stop:1582 length:468 start_codon:yes stop_codon:yes gene_type:complete